MSVPTGFDALYKEIAGYYANMYDSLDSVEAEALSAVNSIVNTQASDFQGQGRQIEILFLNRFNQAYTASRNIKSSTVTILDAVRAINNYVISAVDAVSVEGEESVSDAKLRNFINVTITWDEGACPLGWAKLSEEAGYLISSWDTTS